MGSALPYVNALALQRIEDGPSRRIGCFVAAPKLLLVAAPVRVEEQGPPKAMQSKALRHATKHFFHLIECRTMSEPIETELFNHHTFQNNSPVTHDLSVTVQ